MAVSSETSLAICFHFFTAASTMRLYYAQVLCISRRLGARTPHQRPRRGGRSSGCPAVRSSVLGSRARTDVDKQQQVEAPEPHRRIGHRPLALSCWSARPFLQSCPAGGSAPVRVRANKPAYNNTTTRQRCTVASVTRSSPDRLRVAHMAAATSCL
jgi:hypothetical protein